MNEMMVDQNAPVRGSAEIHIAAPLQVVWEVLTDFESWPTWNKSVTKMRIDGPLAPGTKFHWKAGTNIASTIQEVSPRTRIVWTGRTLVIKAVHVWLIQTEKSGVLVQTEESFPGLLPRVFASRMRRLLRNSLEQGLECLRHESETRLNKPVSALR